MKLTCEVCGEEEATEHMTYGPYVYDVCHPCLWNFIRRMQQRQRARRAAA